MMSAEQFTEENLRVMAEICAGSNNVGLHTLWKFSVINRGFSKIVQWKIDNLRALCKKWSPKIEKALAVRAIGHPFRYTGKTTKTIPIGEFNYNLQQGIVLFNAAGMDFPAECLPALADVCILSTEKVPFYYTIAISQAVILFDMITPDNYIDLSMFSSKKVDTVSPKYMVCLRLPLRNNPIPFDPMFASQNDVTMSIGAEVVNIAWQQEGDETGAIIPHVTPNINCLQHFTHIMMSFLTSPRVNNYADYALMHDGTTNIQAMTTSFVRPISEANET